MTPEEYEIEQLKKICPEFREKVEITKRKYPNKSVLIEENRKTIKKILEQKPKQKNPSDLERIIKEEAKPIIKGRYSVFIENNPLAK